MNPRAAIALTACCLAYAAVDARAEDANEPRLYCFWSEEAYRQGAEFDERLIGHRFGGVVIYADHGGAELACTAVYADKEAHDYRWPDKQNRGEVARFLRRQIAPSSPSKGITVGLHIGSAHLPDNGRVNNVNPGLYVRTAEGWTAGFYRNSLRRTSVYAGYSHEWGPVGLLLGGVTGYDKEHGGHSTTKVAPLVALSIRGPQVFGITPRIAYIPGRLVKSSDVITAMIERSF